MSPDAPTATRPTGSAAPIKILRGRFIATASRPATAPSHTLRVKLRTNADPVTAAGATQRRPKISKAGKVAQHTGRCFGLEYNPRPRKHGKPVKTGRTSA